ncbi:MAG: trypsin-like serine protease [Sulfitobacter sp.]|nr:trypsin-like serine protease [Sulfitobacter sp.]
MKTLLKRAVAAVLATGTIAFAASAQSSGLRSLNTENAALAWQAVGRLDAKNGYCTGTLISPDLVLTAAHCVFDAQGKPLKAETLTFNAGLTGGNAVARRSVVQIEVNPNYDPTTTISANNVRHDVAMVRLEEPIPTSVLDPFRVHQGTLPNGPVSVVSYGRGRSSNLSRQDSCQVVQNYQQILTMDCNVTFGSSGAPVFTHLNGRGRIVSIISGIGQQAGKQYAYGMELPTLVAELKRKMYANKVRPTATIRRLQTGSGKSSSGAKFVTVGGS